MTPAPVSRLSSGTIRPDDVRAAIDNLGYDLKLREFAPRTEIGIRNFNERCEELAAALSRTLPVGNTLESLVREYARDLRRNSSGADLSPDELRNNAFLADYLEELIRRSRDVAQAEKDPQAAFNLGFRAAGGGCYLPPSTEALFQSWLRDGFAVSSGREREEEIPAASPPAPLQAGEIMKLHDAAVEAVAHNECDCTKRPERDAARQRLEQAVTLACCTSWQPIETAPKDGLSILLGWEGSSASEGFWHNGASNYWKLAGFYFSDDDLLTAKPCSPTHWMHLPEGPAVTSQDRGST